MTFLLRNVVRGHYLLLTRTALDHIIQQLQESAGSEFDLWSIAQFQPHFFKKGGDYYKQVMMAYEDKLADNTHFQFREFPNKTFAFNQAEERLDVSTVLQLHMYIVHVHVHDSARLYTYSRGWELPWWFR